MTDEVAALVLRDNYEQTQAHLDARRRRRRRWSTCTSATSGASSRPARSNRELEVLPDRRGARRAPGRRRRADRARARGAARATPRSRSTQELLASDLPEDPYLASELERYFPTPLRERFADADAAPPAAARDHRHAGRQRPRQPRRHDLRLPPRRGDRRRRRRHRPRLRRRARGLRAPRPLGGDRGARRARRRAATQIAMLLEGAHPGRARDALAAAQPPPAARHRGDGRPLRRRRGGARRGAARRCSARPSARPRERGRASVRRGGVPPELAQRVAHLEALVPRSTSSRSPPRPRLDVAAAAARLLRARRAARAALAARPDRRRCRARRAGRRWRAPRCATTSTPSRRA